MRKIFKQTMSAALAAAMVFTLAPVASADDTVTVKPGLELEGYVDKHVYDVTLPTIPTTGKTGFEFVADPQGLLSTADKTTYPDGAGAVYFQTKAAVEADDTQTPAVTASPAEYSADSKDVTIINNSSFDVDVSLKIDVKTEGSGLTLAEEAALATATTPSLYLGLIKRGDTDTETSVATTKTAKETLAKIGEAEFNTDDTVKTQGYAVLAMSDDVYTDAGTTEDQKKGFSTTASPSGYHYKYGLTDGYDAETNGTKLSYAITGACDSKTDWSKVDTSKVDIDMVWTITDPDAEPEVTDDYKIAIAADGTASYTFVTKPSTDSTGITALGADDTDRLGAASAGNVKYDAATGVLSFNATAVANFIAAASEVTATINGEDFTFTVVDPFVISITGTGDSAAASLTFDAASKPTGNITALKVNGSDDRMPAVTAGNVEYNATTGVLSFKAPAVNNFLSAATSVSITIGSDSYTLRVTK